MKKMNPSNALMRKSVVTVAVTYIAGRVKCLTENPWGASSIPTRSQTFVEIDHVIISMAILLPSSLPLIQEGLL